jgi:hypothetical protein
MLKKIIHWIVFVSAALQLYALAVLGQNYMPGVGF